MTRVLLEVGTEAIPAEYLPPALRVLEESVREALREGRIAAASVRARGTGTRLVLELTGVAARQEDRVREVQGPRVEAAFRDGAPTPAAIGFARKNGVAVEALERATSEKGEFVLARVQETGRPAREVLIEILPRLVTALPWPKTMVWNESRFRFPRPVRWVAALWDDEVLPLAIGGVTAGGTTRGHRLVHPEPVAIGGAGGLESALEGAGVILDPEARRRRIADGLAAEGTRVGGAAIDDPGLLDEVMFLAEFPTVLSGRFDPEFLSLPREVVVTAMRAHQRYFAVQGKDGDLLPHFLVVADGRWDDPSLVVAGNERVLRARLADARFYWEKDGRTGLEGMARSLASIVWLEAVGSLAEKGERVAALVDRLGERWEGGAWTKERDGILRAARLAKADLASEMIKDGKEFTGLQGIMGARYAEAAGEDPVLIQALLEQYLPRGAGDALPRTPGGTLLSFADRLDTVVGCWAAGFVPTGSQDPYALRRGANGMMRMLLEKGLHLPLGETVAAAAAALPDSLRRDGLVPEILDFLADRLAFFLRERGIPYDVVDAVLAAGADDPLDALARAEALQAIRGEESLERLVIGFKRAANILKGIDETALPAPDRLEWTGAHGTERALHEASVAVGGALARARTTKDYPAMLERLLELRAPIDRFFDDVMVMSENPAERDRRLALLAEARGLFHHVFDPARIVIEGEAAPAR